MWYRELAGKPLYSFDLRGRPPNTAKHWSADPTFGFGPRANFRVGTGAGSPTALVLKTVRTLAQLQGDLLVLVPLISFLEFFNALAKK